MYVNHDKNDKLLFRLDKNDFDVQYYKGSGAGGQKRNKTSSACRIIHKESGARGQCENHRSKEQNKKEAFKRLRESSEFQTWFKMKVAEVSGVQESIEQAVNKAMHPNNIKMEIKEDGVWKEGEEK